MNRATLIERIIAHEGDREYPYDDIKYKNL